MTNLVLLGPPGAGKGTQSKKLIEKYGIVHISTGDLFRWHLKNDTVLGKKTKNIINNGLLVPDEITVAMLKEKVDDNPKAKGFLFDGFPRTIDQAKELDLLMKEIPSIIHFVIALDVPEAILRARIAQRRDIEKRVDDEEEKIHNRVSEYFGKTIQILPFYQQQNRLNQVSGIGNIDDIFNNICNIIDGRQTP